MEWRYNIEGGAAKLFENGEEINDAIWMDSPVKCNEVVDVQVIDGVSRDEMKAEADILGIIYPSNVKTEKLKLLIEEAKNASI